MPRAFQQARRSVVFFRTLKCRAHFNVLFCAPSMGADLAVKVRYTLGSEEC
jgi:hypothetical protein